MKIKRILALFIVCAMVLPLVGITASAAEAPDVSGLNETSVIEKQISTTDLKPREDGSFDGYIQSMTTKEFLTSDYIKVTYTVTGSVADDADLFTLQPYEVTEWSGWQNNFITIGGSVSENGVYTAYVRTADVIASFKGSKDDFVAQGINISFVEPPEGVVVTLTDYAYLSQPSGLPETKRGWLEYSINYSKALDPAKYQDESFKTFQSAITTAEGVLNNASATDSQLEAARKNLEAAKSNLLFKDSTEPGDPQPFRVLSPQDTVSEMGVGWNLGNTMDGHNAFHPGETIWQSVATTKDMIRSVHDAGFNTVRIPVTWGDMIDDENGYAINDAWINRVQDIVDYCVELDMYAIINIHHDGADGWLSVGFDDLDYVYEKYENVWRHIAEKFKDYDEHLIFEAANELTSTTHDSGNKNDTNVKNYDIPLIMNLNQICVNVVRSTGSNNAKRWISAVSHFANAGTDSAFKMPTDSYNTDTRLMFAAHIYKNSSNATWTYSEVYEVVDQLRKMSNKFKNYPMILGEYGNRNKLNKNNPSGFNDYDRAYFDEIVTRACQVAKVVPCVWDQGWFDMTQSPDSSWSVWNREGKKPIFKSITDAMMRGMFVKPSSSNMGYDMKDIVINPEVTPITEIVPDKTVVEMEIGGSEKIDVSVQPAENNDVVIWKSDNDDVATAYNGLIQGVKIGTANVTAYSQSGEAQAVIKVIVKAKESTSPAQSITVAQNGYELMQNKYLYIDAAADNGEKLYYYTSNENVATVNAFGKVVGAGPGAAYITIAAESGTTYTVPVIVTEASSDTSINVALNVLYGGSYAGTERGPAVRITSDGQYKAEFDLTKDLSDAGKKAGVSDIKDFVAIYLKDYDVDTSGALKTPVDTCEIKYDEIKVNGEPLTITKNDYKSAIKDSGIFDTNDPFNAWDGSAVSDDHTVTDKDKHIMSFKNIEKPTKVEVTFTIRNLAFTQTEEGRPATSINSEISGDITVPLGAELEVPVSVEPADTTSLVSFVSGNRSVLISDTRGAAVTNGTASGLIYGVKIGDTTLTAVTDSGEMITFNVHVVADTPFTDATAVVEDGKITAVTAAVHSVPESESVTVIAAAYDADGALSGMQAKIVTSSSIPMIGMILDGFDVPVPEGGSAKAFIWSSTDTIEPLAK